MPAVSKAQQRFMGIVRSIQKGNAEASDYSKEIRSAAKSMKKKDVKDFADTDRKGLPEERDYKDEYKKFQSSDKSKKYRAELNKYNRKKGTYGNGDGKDASHKGGKIAGFEKESTNRGRREKSRLKKEEILKLRQMIREELQNSQGEQTDFKKGDLVKDINPDCPHHGSEGEVTKVGKGTITFDVTNNGKNYQEGDELEKTVDQMVKLKESVKEATLSKSFFSGYKVTTRNVKKAIQIAKNMKGNMTGAVKTIEKIKKGLSNDSQVMDALRQYNESVNEGRKWSMHVDGKKIKTYTSKRAAVIAHNKFMKDTDNWKEVSIQAESVSEIFPKGAGRKISKAMQKGIEPQGNIKKVLDVAKNQQSKKIGGTLVDLTTANLMTQVWNKVNDSSKEKMNKMNAKQLTNLILRIWKGVGTPRV